MTPKRKKEHALAIGQIIGYLEGSQGPDRTGGAQVDCGACAQLLGRAALACMQYSGRIYYFRVVVRE
jgi:hypothetical protein